MVVRMHWYRDTSDDYDVIGMKLQFTANDSNGNGGDDMGVMQT